MSEAISNIGNQISSTAGDLVNTKPSGAFGQFGNNKFVSGAQGFLSSNTLVAKVVFLLLVLLDCPNKSVILNILPVLESKIIKKPSLVTVKTKLLIIVGCTLEFIFCFHRKLPVFKSIE